MYYNTINLWLQHRVYVHGTMKTCCIIKKNEISELLMEGKLNEV